jgi:DNA-binding MarR family transcriptional regulator
MSITCHVTTIPLSGPEGQDFSFRMDMKSMPQGTFLGYRCNVVRGQPPRSAAQALEAIAYGSVAVTSRALAAVGLDLTFAQWRVLVIVGGTSEGVSVSEIARRLGAELSATSRLVGRLARRGVVALAKDEVDRRVTMATITAAGLGIRDAVIAHRMGLLTDVVASVDSLTPDAVAALDRVGDAFQRYS